MKYVWSLLTLLLTTPCFAMSDDVGAGDIFVACIKLIGLLLLFAVMFIVPCIVAAGIATGIAKLFEKMGGKPSHYATASAVLFALYALGSRSLKRGRR